MSWEGGEEGLRVEVLELFAEVQWLGREQLKASRPLSLRRENAGGRDVRPRNCAVCNTPIAQGSDRRGVRRYCNKPRCRELHKPPVYRPATCLVCGAVLDLSGEPRRARRFCAPRCANAWWRQHSVEEASRSPLQSEASRRAVERLQELRRARCMG